VILAIVSSDPSFHSDVRAALDSRFRFEAVWNLGYEDAARLLGIKSEERCLNVVNFADHERALPLVRTLSGRPQITTVGVGGGVSRDDVLVMMQAGVRDVVPQFTYRDLLHAVNRAVAVLGSLGEILADVYSFVPAKPGCGATTLATQAAGMAGIGETEVISLRATVKAVDDVECLAATYEEFIEAIELYPERAVGFMKTLVRRLRQMNDLLERAGHDRRGLRGLVHDCRKSLAPFEPDPNATALSWTMLW